jgi:hypothetical protein
MKKCRENVFKSVILNESLYVINDDSGVRTANFVMQENLIVKSTTFLHRSIHKYSWAYSDGKTYSQTNYVSIDKRWHSTIIEIQSFGGTGFVTDHSLMFVKVSEIFSESKQTE